MLKKKNKFEHQNPLETTVQPHGMLALIMALRNVVI